MSETWISNPSPGGGDRLEPPPPIQFPPPAFIGHEALIDIGESLIFIIFGLLIFGIERLLHIHHLGCTPHYYVYRLSSDGIPHYNKRSSKAGEW